MNDFLKKEEITDNRTLTYQFLTRLNERTENLYKKYERSRDFELMLYNELTSRGSITREEFDCLESLFNHSELSVTEIFNQVFN